MLTVLLLCGLQCEELDYGCSKIVLLRCGIIKYCENLGKEAFALAAGSLELV